MNVQLLLLLAQAINLLAFVWFNREIRGEARPVSSAARGLPAQRVEAEIEKQGSAVHTVSRLWKDWRSELFVVRPETVIQWRKPKSRELWRRKSRGRVGRPSIPMKHIQFIRRISSDHPEYGEDRIALELELKFGIRHSPATIRKYRVMGRPGSRDSQAWRTFLRNQSKAIWSYDFCVQHTVGFRAFYVFLIMASRVGRLSIST